ncbi:MAG: hypothetical protein Q8O99_03845 [bacterium]|nr:hypothetical protein [bacterium]
MTNARRFYEMTGYPVPIKKELFAFQYTVTSLRSLSDRWSWLNPCTEQMELYRQKIQRRQWLWKALPFVESVYLSNSIVFNSLHEASNIDFFFVVTPGKLWHAKTRITTVLKLLRLGKTANKQTMSFSANFLLTQDAQDISGLLLEPHDPYLIYRLAHLVPIYHRDFSYQDEIYEHNKRLQYYLPNFPKQQSIFLGIDIEVGQYRTKTAIEFLADTRWGSMWEFLLKLYRLLYLKIRKRYQPELAPHLLVTPKVIKCYDDNRKRYALQWKVRKKSED